MLSRKLKRVALTFNGLIVTDKLRTYEYAYNNNLKEVKTYLESQEGCKFDIVHIDYNGICTVDEHNLRKFGKLLNLLEKVEV